MIEVLDELLQFACPGIGVEIGTKCIHGKYYIDDRSIMTNKIKDLQRVLGIVEQFSKSFGFKVNISVCSTREEQTSLIFKYGISVNSSK